MAAPKPRSGRSTSLRDTSESERMEGAGSWDALEWTKIEPVSRPVSRGNLAFLLEKEEVIVEVCVCMYISFFVEEFLNFLV
ncbi:hypothetical protein L1049_011403 [Liquidambar formosana]|uniref:Uncharacterized protein n=1 Tax=Liquidambar formosana TaxID=63359 RepID=A0AAP0RRL2_LIQFO